MYNEGRASKTCLGHGLYGRFLGVTVHCHAQDVLPVPRSNSGKFKQALGREETCLQMPAGICLAPVAAMRAKLAKLRGRQSTTVGLGSTLHAS